MALPHVASVMANLLADKLGGAEAIEDFLEIAGAKRVEKFSVVRREWPDFVQRIVGEFFRDRACSVA